MFLNSLITQATITINTVIEVMREIDAGILSDSIKKEIGPVTWVFRQKTIDKRVDQAVKNTLERIRVANLK